METREGKKGPRLDDKRERRTGFQQRMSVPRHRWMQLWVYKHIGISMEECIYLFLLCNSNSPIPPGPAAGYFLRPWGSRRYGTTWKASCRMDTHEASQILMLVIKMPFLPFNEVVPHCIAVTTVILWIDEPRVRRIHRRVEEHWVMLRELRLLERCPWLTWWWGIFQHTGSRTRARLGTVYELLFIRILLLSRVKCGSPSFARSSDHTAPWAWSIV